MPSINRVTLCGFLGREPELRVTPKREPVCVLAIATTDKKGPITDSDESSWHRVCVWGTYAERSAKELRKGDVVWLDGKLVTRSWRDYKGVLKSVTEVYTWWVGFGRRPAEGSVTAPPVDAVAFELSRPSPRKAKRT